MTTTTTAGPLRVGVDIGGTFTDVVLMGPDGLRAWTKVSSTTADYSRGIIRAWNHCWPNWNWPPPP